MALLLLRGEWFIVLLILFMAIGFPIMIGGIVWYTLRKNKLNRAAWNQLASEIKFHMPNPRHLEMLGNYNGIETRLAVGMRSHGSGEDRYREYFTSCTSHFPKPLRFALQISSPTGVVSKLFKGGGTPIGNPNFDKQFGSKSYDPKVLQRLLLSDFPSQKTGNLMGDLMLAAESYNTITLTDKKVYIEAESHIRDHDKLKHLLLVTNNLAKRFADARKKFPLEQWEKQIVANWAAFAQKYSLSFDQEAIALQGVYKGFPLRAWIHSEPGKWKTSLELRYPQKLMVGFQIYPEAAIYSAVKLFGFQDLKVGHREFDDAFIVKAKNVQVAKSKINEDFCNQMVGLRKNASAIKLDDEKLELTVDRVLGDVDMLKSFVNGMGSAMSKLR